MLLLTEGIVQKSPIQCYHSGYEKKAGMMKNPEDTGYFRQIAEPIHHRRFRLFLTRRVGRVPWSCRQLTAPGKRRFMQGNSPIEHKTLHMAGHFPAKDIRSFMKISGALHLA